jgi:ABC-2 type transport system permease protein
MEVGKADRLGSGYAQQIITTEITDFLSNSEGVPLSTVNLDVLISFNPNITTAWFTSVMGIINSVTMLAIILSGAAIVREREHGTMDHLLVMPLTPFEIAMSKVWANGVVIAVAVGLSLYLVVRLMLGIPIAGSIPLFMEGGLPVFRHCDRHLSGYGGAFNAPTRPSLHAGLSAHEHAVGQQYSA